MTIPNADRNLLIGILALQMDFIGRDQLVEAMSLWVVEKSKSLDEILLERDSIDASVRDLILSLVDKHIELHHDDPEKSLAAIGSLGDEVRADLNSLNDSSVAASLAVVASLRIKGDSVEPSDTTDTFNVSQSSEELRFQVLRPHAKGGLGTVSIALDKELNREVALKEIQEQRAHQQESRARFLLEAEITGGLEHPGIVPVYGLGTYSDGRPFYAMRFIKGESLKEAAAQFHKLHKTASKQDFQSLSFRKLLGRFIDVCNAIEYAHSRGVLHRDLKPGNIMLGKYGETLVVDWGLSKIVAREELGTRFDEPTLKPSSGSGAAPTQMGSAIGTPAYMSPEQAAGRLDDLGPMSDVYSLGATLYFLLVGRTPILEQDIGELLQRVQSGDIDTPTEINPRIPKALEAICLRAMAKNSRDRYPSPGHIAEEIEHWLADEPIDAYREPVSVQTWRWVRRHQSQVSSIALVLVISVVSLGIISGVVVAANQKLGNKNKELIQANSAEKRAKEEAEGNARQLELANVEIAEKERQVRQERDTAVAIFNFVRDDILGQSSPFEEPDRNITLRAILDRASNSVSGRFSDNSRVESAVSQTLGHAYFELGEYELARPHVERAYELRRSLFGEAHPQTLYSANSIAVLNRYQGRFQDSKALHIETLATRRKVLGDEDPETLVSMNDLAELYTSLGEYSEAESLHEQTLQRRRQVLGETHPETLTSMNNLAVVYYYQARYDEAETLLVQLLESRRRDLGSDHPTTLSSLNNLGFLYFSSGRLEEAQPLMEQSLETGQRLLGEEHPQTLTLMSNLALLYNSLARYSEAEPLFAQSLYLRRKVLGEEHPLTIDSINNLAVLYQAQGRYEDAEPLFVQALELRLRVQGEQHPNTVNVMANLAALYLSQNRYEKAEPLLDQSIVLRQRLLGDEHPETLLSMNNLAALYLSQGRLAEAESLYAQTVNMRKKVLGEDHPDTLFSMNSLAVLYQTLGRFNEAEPIYEQVLEARARALGDVHPDTLISLNNLAALYVVQGRYSEAEPLLEQTVSLRQRVSGDEHPETLTSMGNLADLYSLEARYGEADSLLLEVLSISRRKGEDGDLQTVTALDRLGMNLLAQEKFDDAEEVLKECLEIRERLMPGQWPIGNTRSLLGDALLGQQRYEEAESLLIDGYRGMEQIERSIPSERKVRLIEAMQRVAALYATWNKPDQARDWRSQLIGLRLQTGLIEKQLANSAPPKPM